MKKVFLFIALSALSLWPLLLKSQVVGGEMDYRCLGQGRYELFASIDVVCGNSYHTPLIYCAVNGDTIQADSLMPVGSERISGPYPGCAGWDSCRIDSLTHTTYRLRYRAVVDLDTFTGCITSFFVLATTQNHGVTLSNRNAFFAEARVNRCLAPCDASPTAKTSIRRVLPHNQDVFLQAGMQNPDYPADSFSYHFSPARTDQQAITYAGSYHEGRWITFFGFPNQHLQWPAGMHLNQQTGEVRFRPTQQAQTGSLCMEVVWYREINDTMRETGRKYLEAAVSVLQSNTAKKAPTLSQPAQFSFCVDRPNCYTIHTNDLDTTDSTFLTISGMDSLPGAMLVPDRQGRLDGFQICWTPDSTHSRQEPYLIEAVVRDNSCPVNRETRRIYQIIVRPLPGGTLQLNQSGNCGLVSWQWQPYAAYPGLEVFYEVSDSAHRLLHTGRGLTDSVHLPNGKHYLKIHLFAPGFCSMLLLDSVEVINSAYPALHISPKFLNGCIGDSAAIGVLGASGLSHSWQDGLTDPLRHITLGPDTPYYILTSSNMTCVRQDTFFIHSDSLPDPAFSIFWPDSANVRLSVMNPHQQVSYAWNIDAGGFIHFGSVLDLPLSMAQDHHFVVRAQRRACAQYDSITWKGITGIDPVQGAAMSVYPNPFGNYLFLQSEAELVEIRLYDAKGTEIAVRIEQSEGGYEIRGLDGLTPAVYLLQALDSNGIRRSVRVLKLPDGGF